MKTARAGVGISLERLEESLGANLANSTDLSQEGSHSLALEYDLAATPDEPRARIEHYASAPLNGLRKLSAWIYISAETQLTPLQVQFFAWTTSEVWSVNEFQVVQPNTWTYLETSAFNPVLTYAQVKMLGIELKLPASSAVTSLKGTAFIDQFHIESNP